MWLTELTDLEYGIAFVLLSLILVGLCFMAFKLHKKIIKEKEERQ